MRQHKEAHLKFIRSLPCIVCGDNTSTEAAHVRMSDPRIGKDITGIGIKPHDYFVVPLCGECHRRQHQMSERLFWRHAGIDPVLKALALYAASGDVDEADKILNAVTNILAAG